MVTNVGEITNYLEDEVHAFIAEPNCEISFSEKLKYVLKNSDDAKRVGINGNKLTHQVFNYKVQAERLAQFFTNRN